MSRSEKLRQALRRGRRIAQKIRGKSEPHDSMESAVLCIGEMEREVPSGTTVLAAAIAMGQDIDHYCGGHCSCGSCRVRVVSGSGSLSRPRPDEKMVLGPDADQRGDRLACQARIQGRVEIEIPEFCMV